MLDNILLVLGPLQIHSLSIQLFLFQIEMHVNNMDIRFPHQCFIDNEFVDSSDGVTYETVNPTDEKVCCTVLGRKDGRKEGNVLFNDTLNTCTVS